MRPETIQLLKNIAWGVGLLLVVALLLWGAWHVTRLPALTIDQVLVTGGETINHDRIRADVTDLLQGEYWGFIPRTFAYTYPHQEIYDALTTTPRVKDPIIQRQGKALRVTLAEFEPVALWCDGTATSSATTTDCVFLDENGYGFAVAPSLTGGAYTRYSLVGTTATTSAVYTDGGDFAALRTLEETLTEYGWPVRRIELDQARDVFVHLVGDSELKITLTMTIAEIMDNLDAVLGAEQYQHFAPGNFAYIDLRFGNKVFVSEFGEPEVETDVVADEQEKTATSSQVSGE